MAKLNFQLSQNVKEHGGPNFGHTKSVIGKTANGMPNFKYLKNKSHIDEISIYYRLVTYINHLAWIAGW